MKQELIEAIKATIVPNDEKAITAESLANLLTEMVEAMGEGSGVGISFIVRLRVDEEENLISASTVEDIAHNKSQIEVLKQSKASGKPSPPIAINVTGHPVYVEIGDSTLQFGSTVVSWGGVQEGMFPEGTIFPIVITELEYFINGDGNLLPLN